MVVINTAILANSILDPYKKSAHKINEGIPAKFKSLTLEIEDICKNLFEKGEEISKEIPHSSVNELKVAEETAVKFLTKVLAEFMEPATDELSSIIANLDSKIKKECFQYFRDHISYFINQGPFTNRSLNKPLGYAGDYEMMNMLYREEAVGKTLFGKAIHCLLVNSPAANAVKNRARYLQQKLNEFLSNDGKYQGKTLSVASGPAKEIQLIMEQYEALANAEFHLLDQDLTSLQYAQKELTKRNANRKEKPKFEFFNLSIKNVIDKGLPKSNYDVIYSAGLFDYFPDHIATKAAEQLAKGIKKGGHLIIGNFDVSCPTRPLLELALDWFLIYRSESDLHKLFGHIGTARIIEREPEKINLFYVITI